MSSWNDLRVRILSAVVMLAVAAGAYLAGEAIFAALVAVVAGLMQWELSRMHTPRGPWVPICMGGVMAVLCFVPSTVDGFGAIVLPQILISFIAMLCVANLVLHLRGRGFLALYAVAVFATGVLLPLLEENAALLLLLLGLVIATDVAGYFVGRMLGGPKFWPRVSPKKTWSGVIGGWAASGVIAGGGVVLAGLPLWAVPAAIAMSFASQLGDIAESAMKRAAGVKDSSNLIPGHGGFLDRFDGVIGASVVLIFFLLVAGGL